jgi:hypothetical protein
MYGKTTVWIETYSEEFVLDEDILEGPKEYDTEPNFRRWQKKADAYIAQGIICRVRFKNSQGIRGHWDEVVGCCF